MNTYRFRAHDVVVVVEANDEQEARSLAMEKRWGPPTGMYAPQYRGQGLDLIEVEKE